MPVIGFDVLTRPIPSTRNLSSNYPWLRLPCGFVSPRCHVQGSLSRVFPSREAARARRPPLPSCRSHRPPALGLIQWRQGTVSASRALLRSRVRGDRWWFRPYTLRQALPIACSPYLPASLHCSNGNEVVQEFQPVVHRLRLSAST